MRKTHKNRKRRLSKLLTGLSKGLLVTGLSLSVGLTACGKKDSESEGKAGRPQGTLVDVARVKAQDVQVAVRSVGSLVAVDQVDIAPEINGFVKQIHFKENQQVEKGRLLVELDDRKLKLAVQQAEDALQTAEANLELAKATIRRAEADVENTKSMFERDEELYESGITSEAAFIQSKTAYESASAAVEEAKAARRRAEKELEAAKTALALARERLADTRIMAPLAGILGERLVSPGDYVEAGQKLVELVVMDPLEIGFSVPERYGRQIQVGQPVLFSSPSMPDRTFSGEATYLSPTADPATRSIKLKARLPNKGGLLQPGLFGAVRLVLETHPDAAVIPESAVVPRGEETFVYIVNSSEARLRRVTLGEHFDGSIEVVEGLEPGEVVITAGQQKVADGYPVRIRESEGERTQEGSPDQPQDNS